MTKYLPLALFSLLSAAILGPLLEPGYILVTDMVFGPLVPVSGIYAQAPVLGGSNALTAFEILLDDIFPGWVTQKIFLFLIFFLSATSMFLLTGGNRKSPASYYAAFLYTLNPFVYVRILAGEWTIPFAFALMPLCFLLFLRLVSDDGEDMKRSISSVVMTALLYTLVAVFDIHLFVLLVFLSILYYIVRIGYRIWFGEGLHRGEAARLLCFVALFLLLNAFWIQSAAAGTRSILGSFSFIDAIAFASKPTVLNNTMLSIAAMYGFFRTGYIYPVSVEPLLILIFPFFLLLSLFGFVVSFGDRKEGPIATTLLIAFVTALILGTGISSPLTRGIYTYLYNNLPLFNGFREPQKFVALIVFAYAYLGYLGFRELHGWLKHISEAKEGRRFHALSLAITLLLVFALISPFAYSYMELEGFGGQLSNVMYPNSWYQARDIIASNISGNAVLFLPWHGTMYYNWTHTKSDSPFANFFPFNDITGGSNSYLGGQGAASGFAASLIQGMLDMRHEISSAGNLLSLLDVKYVFLSKSGDYFNYSFLYRQSDLLLVMNSSTVALFVNEHQVYRAYASETLMRYPSIAYLVNESMHVNMLDFAWLPGAPTTPEGYGGSIPLMVKERNPASFVVDLPGLIGLNTSYFISFIPPDG
ncbi:MAG: hypothetical protein QXP70_05210, partial [Methanomassiliicoccales archaeon]